ncbi:hypothetical protein LEP1GSC170_0183, partial [Leptospira interrogans serovar Bataviae str. HAI135]
FEILDFSKSPFAVLDYSAPNGSKLYQKILNRFPDLPINTLDGIDGKYKVSDISLNLQGTYYVLNLSENQKQKISTNLLGSFNVRNTALAFLTGIGIGLDLEKMSNSLKKFLRFLEDFRSFIIKIVLRWRWWITHILRMHSKI